MITGNRHGAGHGNIFTFRLRLVAAAAAPETSGRSGWGDSINVPQARDRMLEYFEREQLPGDVKSTLAAVLNGDLHLQSLLLSALLDTWRSQRSSRTWTRA